MRGGSAAQRASRHASGPRRRKLAGNAFGIVAHEKFDKKIDGCGRNGDILLIRRLPLHSSHEIGKK